MRTHIITKADRGVNESGDQITGNLGMIGNNITQLAGPIRHRDADHKVYVDTQTLSKYGGEMRDDLNMNDRLLHGLPVESSPSYRGDEAVSWAQLTNHVQQTLRPFASREYADEKNAEAH